MPYLRVKNELPLIPGYASGNIASFSDGYPGAPLNMLKVSVIGSQSGSGDPSPDNVRLITAYSQAVITQADGDDTVIETRTVSFGQTAYRGIINPLTGKGIITHKVVDLGDYSWTKDESDPVRFRTRDDSILYQSDLICEIYKSYSGGIAGMTNESISATNSQSFLLLRIQDSRFDDYTGDQVKTALTGCKLAYELATPVEITFTPIPDIPNLSGPNIIQADCGPIELKYIRRLDS